MSLFSNVGKLGPSIMRPLNFIFLGKNPNRRAERLTISTAVIIAVISALILSSSGIQLFANGFGNTISPASASFTVKVNPSSIHVDHSVTISVSIRHFIPDTLVSVTITILAPGGKTYTDNLKIETNGQGNARASVNFPSANFPGSTSQTGVYQVRATFACGYSIHSASTSFRVRQRSHVGEHHDD
jgi:hypothetical protein